MSDLTPSNGVHVTEKPTNGTMRLVGTPHLSLAAATAIFAIGCFGNEVTEFPAGLEPLEENTAPAVASVDGDPHPEVISLVRGEAVGWEWVHARGFVKAPIAEVYDIITDPALVVDDRAVNRFEFTLDTEPDYERSFLIHNEVDDVITVEFDVNWRFGTVEVDNDEPTLISGTFQKTFGTTFISLMRGSIILRRIDDNTSEVEFIEHISAATGGGDDIESFIRDYYDETILVSNGEPIPIYE